MKKLCLLFAFSVVSLCFISAQEKADQEKSDQEKTQENEETYKNKSFFVGLGLKGNVYVNVDGAKSAEVWKKPTAAGDVYFGKWFGDRLGARIALEAGQLKPSFKKSLDTKENFLLGRVDLLLNLTNCFRDYSPDRFYNLSPYIGIGGAQAFNAVNRPDKEKSSSSFVFGGGLLNTFRLSDNLAVYANLGLNVVNAKFDGYKNKKPLNGIASGSIGLVISFGKTTKNESSTSYSSESQQIQKQQQKEQKQQQKQQQEQQKQP